MRTIPRPNIGSWLIKLGRRLLRCRRWSSIDVKSRFHSKHENRATAASAAVDFREEFIEAGCARMHSFTEPLEYWSQIRAAGNDDANVDGPQLEEQPKVIEVPVIDRIFAVSLDFKCDATLDAVDFMSGAVKPCLVDDNRGLEFLFDPLASIKCAVEAPCNWSTVSS